MADGINVPINLPTNASGVSAASAVVKQLESVLAALGPAAEKGSAAAVRGVAAMSAQITKAKAQAAALQGDLSKINAKRDAGIEVQNAKGASAFQLAQQKALFDFGKIRAKQEGALEIQQAKAAAAAANAAKAQVHAQEMARIKQRGAAEKTRAHGGGGAPGKGGTSGGSAAGEEAIGTLENLAPVAGILVSIAAAVGAVIAKVAGLTAAFYAALVAVQAFKESTANAFAKLLGSSKAAEDAMRSTVAMAGKIGVGVKDALGGVNTLLAKGFNAKEAQDLVRAMADLKSVVPDANISHLLLAISQIKSKGVLQMEELQGQIAEAGLNVSVVLEEIGKNIGKSSAEVRKMISAGKVTASQGIAGIMAAIQKTTGKPLGKAAEDAANSLQGLLSRAQDLPTALLLAADASKGMGTVKDVLKNVLAAFGPGSKSGDALAASLGKMGNALSTFLSGLTGKAGGNAMESFATGLAKSIDKMAAYVEKVGTKLGPRIGKAFDMFGKAMDDGTFDHVLDVLTSAIDAFLQTIAVIDAVRDAFNDASAAVNRVAAAFGLVEPQTKALAGSMSASGTSIGGSLVDGIIAGITGGIPGLLIAVARMAATTTGAAKGGFKVASPSRIWRDEIGYQLPAGAAKGIERGRPLMTRAAAGTAANTNAAGAAVGGGASSGRSITIAAGAFVFNGMTRSDADYYEARTRAFLSEMVVA